MDITAARGSIPACAGEPREVLGSVPEEGVDPRVRGGAPESLDFQTLPPGRSPRARGSLLIRNSPKCLGRSIPACAGEPR